MRYTNLLLLALAPCVAQTRLYLPSTGTAAASPPFTLESSWDEVDNADRRSMSTSKASSAMTDRTEGKATTANVRQLIRQYVSAPLSGNQTISGTVKGTIRVNESALNDNIDKVSMKLIVTTNDGQTLRCTLLGKGDYGPTNEWANGTLTARRIADGDTITTCNALDGERIVVEIGYNNTTTGTSITGTMNFGDNSASDLGDNETDTAANNPFLELTSVTLSFQAEVIATPQLTLIGAGK